MKTNNETRWATIKSFLFERVWLRIKFFLFEIVWDRITNFLSVPVNKYVVTITSIISALVIAEAFYDLLVPASWHWIPFISIADKKLVINFVEWFGVLYGFLLPTILVRVWEQFDKIDNTFDKEADAIKILVGDLLLLHSYSSSFSKNVLETLRDYTENVFIFMDAKISKREEVQDGDRLLARIRNFYMEVFRSETGQQKENDVIMGELLEQLNNIIDNRGDRISLCDQRLFESLKSVAVITSIVWLVPFYFLYFQNNNEDYLQLGLFGWLLVIAVTFLVIIILSIIDDLDEPFGGHWKVNRRSWEELKDYIKGLLDKKEPDNTMKNHDTTSAPPQPESPVVISLITENPTAGVDLQKVKESKPNGRKPGRKKIAVSTHLVQQEGKKPKKTKSNSKVKKRSSSIPSTQSQVDIPGNEVTEKVTPSE